MKILKLKLAVIIAFASTGCSSLVTHYIQRAGSFDYGNIASEKEIAALGFRKDQYCSLSIKACVNYLSGEPMDGNHLKYETELTSGASSTEVTLNLSRESVPTGLHGTVVLLHGFRASKEFMINSALYFRFLGFNVLVPDLLGHGDSEGEKAYGVNDSYITNELISSQHAPEENLFLLGNSMGALTAAYLSTMRDDIKGIILQAPMLEFDDAVLRYTRAYYPYSKLFLSDGTILNGALGALKEANLEVEDTDISKVISSSVTPVLILASSRDPVAPYDRLKHMDSGAIIVRELPDRNHPAMSVIGDDSSRIILDWLKALTGNGSGWTATVGLRQQTR